MSTPTPVPSHSAYIEKLVLRDPSAIASVSGARPLDHYYSVMDTVGIDRVLELYASGFLLVEIAGHYNWPNMAFDAWMTDRAPADQLSAAKRLCAETYQARASAILTMDRRDAADASLMTALSRNCQNVAAKLAPGHWGGTETLGVGGGPAVVLNISLDSNEPFAGRVVTPKVVGEEQAVGQNPNTLEVQYATLGLPPADQPGRF